MSFSEWLYQSRDHDYDPGWDYEQHEEPPQNLKSKVQEVAQEIKRDLLPQLKIFRNFTVFFAAPHSLGNDLGKYVIGTVSEPVIILDINGIEQTCQEYRLPIELGIETTITHELAHAIQEAMDLGHDEEQAEEFAKQWHYNRRVIEF